MAILRVDDSAISSVQIAWDNRPDWFLTKVTVNLEAVHQRQVLEGFLTINRWDDVVFMAEGVYQRQSRGMDMRGFAYPSANSAPGSDLQDSPGVDLFIFDGSDSAINLSERAFTQLMSRLFQTLIAGAVQDRDPVTQTSWWKNFVNLADQIALRASERP